MSPRREPLLVLGIVGQYPMAGVAWQAIHHLLGFQALGWDVYYVEDSGAPPYDPASGGIGTTAAGNLAYLADVMDRYGFADRWAYWDGLTDAWHGRDRPAVHALLRDADGIFTLCGATNPRAEHRQGARLCYVETDPMYEQMRVADGIADAIGFLATHDVLFTYGELLGTPSCRVPAERFTWHPTRPPVVCDLWRSGAEGRAFASVATWENKGKNVVFRGETYRWSKHVYFLRMIDVPRASGLAFELAMDPGDDDVRARLASHGWTLVDPRPISADVDAYRAYVERSRGEFTVAKDIYVRPRSGWFSDRSVCFLAAGRPVVTQETGFSELIPSGRGLLAFSTMEEALRGIESINADYAAHCAAARRLAEEQFAAPKVLQSILERAGVV